MKVDMILRPGRDEQVFVFLTVMTVMILLSVGILLLIESGKPGIPDTPARFAQGERVTVLVNKSSGIVKKIYYNREGWLYNVRLAVGMEIMEFSEDELAKHANGALE